MKYFTPNLLVLAVTTNHAASEIQMRIGDTDEEDRFWKGFLFQGVNSMSEPTPTPSTKPTTTSTFSPTSRPSAIVVTDAPSTTAPSSSCQSLAQMVCSVPEFSFLCDLVTTAGLGETLGEDIFTLFAPTNDAFESLPLDVADFLGSDIDLLRSVILYHTVPELALFTDDLICDGSIMMGNQEETVTRCGSNGEIFQVGSGNSEDTLPLIFAQDGVACNGVLHAVNQVILPALTEASAAPTDIPTTLPVSTPASTTSPTALPISTPAPTLPCVSIAESICALPEFRLLCALVTNSGLSDALSGEEKFTVFAPVNDAFESLPMELSEALTTDNDLLTQVLLTHAAPGEVFSFDLPCDGKLEMVSGELTTTTCFDEMVFQVGGGNTLLDFPKILATDGVACNGVIHAIDQVILPTPATAVPTLNPETVAPTESPSASPTTAPTTAPAPTLSPATAAPTTSPIDFSTSEPSTPSCESIAEVICSLPEFELLCSLAGLVDWAGALSGSEKLTLFAPVNEAFESLPLEISDAIIADPDILSTVLLTHVLDGEFPSTSLECNAEIAMASGEETVTLCSDDGRIFQIGGGNADASPEIIGPDGFACNGVIHAMDQVILPSGPLF